MITADQSVEDLINALGDTKYKIVTQEAPNGNIVHYKIINGTAYHFATDDNIINNLEHIRLLRFAPDLTKTRRVRIYYGDIGTGKAWGDKDEGYIGRTTGQIKCPIVIHNKRSFGGSLLLDDRIVKIEYTNKKRCFNRIIYQHPNYHEEE